MKAILSLSLLLLTTLPVLAEKKAEKSTSEVVCSWAPSQDSKIAALVGAGSGAAATTASLGAALGMTAVWHSSGTYILTGSAGYIAGTLGAASAAPVIVVVGTVAGVGAVTIELACAPRNHPEAYKRVIDASVDYGKRVGAFAQQSGSQVRSASSRAYTLSVVKVVEWKELAAKEWAKIR